VSRTPDGLAPAEVAAARVRTALWRPWAPPLALLAGVLALGALLQVRQPLGAGPWQAPALALLRVEPPGLRWIWVHPGSRGDLAEALAPRVAVAADRLPRAWLRQPGGLLLATEPDAAVDELLRGVPAQRRHALPNLGTWRVIRWDPPAGGAPQELGIGPGLSVERVDDGAPPRPCPWRPGQGRHVCDGPSWNHLRAAELQSGGETEACLWLHPVRGAAMVLRWSERRLGRGLSLRAALSDHAVRNPSGAPVRVGLGLAGGDPLHWLEVPNAPGWRATFVATEPGERGAPLVRVELGPGSPGARHFCLQAAVEP